MRHLLNQALRNRPFVDHALCQLLSQRLKLPPVMLPDLFDDFDDQPVTLRKMPRGSWSTPTQDVTMLVKLARCAKSQRILEIGSFRGYTALYLAQNRPDARIVTIDHHADHGEAYRQTPEASRIERRIGWSGAALFAQDAAASYDLIFIDADHTYEAVRRDTELALPLVAPTGYIVWHDYANWGYFSGRNEVPEYLKDISARLSMAHALGSALALYSPAWDIEGTVARDRYLNSTRRPPPSEAGLEAWSTTALR